MLRRHLLWARVSLPLDGSACWAELCAFGRNGRAEASPALLLHWAPTVCQVCFQSPPTIPLFKAGGLGTQRPRDTSDQTWWAVWRITGMAPKAPT